MLEDSGFTNITIGPAIDTFGGTAGEEQARAFDLYGYTFLAFKEARTSRASPGLAQPQPQSDETAETRLVGWRICLRRIRRAATA